MLTFNRSFFCGSNSFFTEICEYCPMLGYLKCNRIWWHITNSFSHIHRVTNFLACAVDTADQLPYIQNWLSTELIKSRINSVDWQNNSSIYRYGLVESRNPRSTATLHSTGSIDSTGREIGITSVVYLNLGQQLQYWCSIIPHKHISIYSKWGLIIMSDLVCHY